MCVTMVSLNWVSPRVIYRYVWCQLYTPDLRQGKPWALESQANCNSWGSLGDLSFWTASAIRQYDNLPSRICDYCPFCIKVSDFRVSFPCLCFTLLCFPFLCRNWSPQNEKFTVDLASQDLKPSEWAIYIDCVEVEKIDTPLYQIVEHGPSPSWCPREIKVNGDLQLFLLHRV